MILVSKRMCDLERSLKMIRLSFLCVMLVITECGGEAAVNRSQTVLEKTVEMLFSNRSHFKLEGVDIFQISPRQRKMCRRDPGLANVLLTAKQQALAVCEESFYYDRWNCSAAYNTKVRKSVFAKVYRETAFVHALMGASISHAVAKGCASGELTKCSCATVGANRNRNSSWQFKRGGCGDDHKYGKRTANKFLELKKIDRIGEVLKVDVMLGFEAVSAQMSEVCRCHGFSGSCTTKTCWKRLAPFNSAMGALKKLYHHAIKRKLTHGNSTSKTAIVRKVRKKMESLRKKMAYLQKSPNLCWGTKRRECRNPDNCATLCCGRGYVTRKKKVKTKCKCKMVNCCFVQCDTCVEEAKYYICK